jgi:hypothetical protein
MFEMGGVRESVAGLAASASAAPQGVSSSEWVGVVADCQRLVNALSAVQTVALARLSALEEEQAEDGTTLERDLGVGHQRLDAPALVSDVLGLTDAGAAARVGHAVRVASKIPELVTAMAAGDLDCYRAAVVSEELTDADAEVCAEVMGLVKPHLGAEPAGALRRRVRRALGQVAPDLVQVKAARARADRALRRWTYRAGTDEWSGTFPVEQARPAWAVIDKLAKSFVREGRSANLDQARADALMALIHRQASGTFLVQVAISADDLAAHTEPEGPDDELVEVSGLGIPGITHVSRAWLNSLPGAPFTTHTKPGETTEATEEHTASSASSRAASQSTTAPDPGGHASAAAGPSRESTTAPDPAEGHASAAATAAGPSRESTTAPDPAKSHMTGLAAPTLDPAVLGAFLEAVTELAVCDPVTGALLGRLDRIGPLEREDEPAASRSAEPNASGRRARREVRKRRPRARGGETAPTYQPPAWLAAQVKARDGGCRFPGCTVATRFCDLDHVTPWPTGPTAAWNLICVCRRHHRIKQRPGWSVCLAGDGTTTWTDPTGRLRTTTPQNLLNPHPNTAPGQPVPQLRTVVDPERLTFTHPVAAGITGSWSALEEDLELAIMIDRHQHGHTDRARSAAVPSSHHDDRPPPGCRTRLRHDLAHPSTLRTFTFEWPAHHHDYRSGRRRPITDDPPPF